MNTVKLKNILLGEGMPKICVPLSGADPESLLSEAAKVGKCPDADLAEWRADYFEIPVSPEEAAEITGKVRAALGSIPLLVTFRSVSEGGGSSLTDEEYEEMLTAVSHAGADMVDIELTRGQRLVEHMIGVCHGYGTAVLISSHEFYKTPSVRTMVARLERMITLGADVSKLAVMPRDEMDTLRVMEATLKTHKLYPNSVIAAMAMGSPGVVSRVTGEAFGSSLTFGTVGRPTAPGQISAEALKKALEALHSV